ncbi:hypothetical protein [Neisseria sp. P0021.S004]|uniref:hypothetical protein n=1 Tax=Neisseria sp. P0021.S004 TaxID=3436819 RepID=UPI003F81AC43
MGLGCWVFLGGVVGRVGFGGVGVFRGGESVVCGQSPVPESLVKRAEEVGAELLVV